MIGTEKRLDLDVIEAMVLAAADGPWFAHNGEFVSTCGGRRVFAPYVTRNVKNAAGKDVTVFVAETQNGGDADTAIFIAESRTLIPRLVTAIRQLESIHAAVRAGCTVDLDGTCSKENPCRVHNCATPDSDDNSCGCVDEDGMAVPA